MTDQIDNNYNGSFRRNIATAGITATLAELQALVDATPDGYELVLPEAEYVLRTGGELMTADPGYLTINKNIKITGRRTSNVNYTSNGTIVRNIAKSTISNWVSVGSDVWEVARPGGITAIFWEGQVSGFRRFLQFYVEDNASITAATVPTWGTTGGNMRVKLGAGINPNNEVLYFGSVNNSNYGDQVILFGANVQEFEMTDIDLLGGAQRCISWQSLNQANAPKARFTNVHVRHCGVQRVGGFLVVNQGQGFQMGGSGRFEYDGCVVEACGWDGFNFKYGGLHKMQACHSAWVGATAAMHTLAAVASSSNAVSPHYGSVVEAQDCYFGPSSAALVAPVSGAIFTADGCVIEGDATNMVSPCGVDVFDANSSKNAGYANLQSCIVTACTVGLRTAHGSRIFTKATSNDCATPTSGTGILVRT
jgi:hypothetical protein